MQCSHVPQELTKTNIPDNPDAFVFRDTLTARVSLISQLTRMSSGKDLRGRK
ncbi:hypothetical protein ACVMB1_000306 [Bradyrhizobium sp. USDA 4504]